jgi:hypothetical protein
VFWWLQRRGAKQTLLHAHAMDARRRRRRERAAATAHGESTATP